MDGGPGTAVTLDEDGVQVRRGWVGDFVLEDLVFPSSYWIPTFEPEEPYIVVVLTGALDKSFSRTRQELGGASVVTMPQGAGHSTQFASQETRVLLVRPQKRYEIEWPELFADLRHLKDGALTALGWRLAGELHARDAVWPVAAEGLALELVAALSRRSSSSSARRPPPWLQVATDFLHEQPLGEITIERVAEAASVHPAHLARVFREQHGMPIGAYVRRLRLDWATARLAATDAPVGAIAAEAGFADQSHFTRAFKRHTGLTPAHYRRVVRG
jgi:AraC family transcriptional regulator